MNRLSTLIFTLFASTAQAQTADFAELTPSNYLQKDLTASIGLGIASLPKYADGSQQHVLSIPIVDLQWKSGVFLSTTSGFGYNFSADPAWQYGLRLGLIANQEQSASNHDNGPGNTKTAIAPGVFANYLIDKNVAVLTALTTGAGAGTRHNGFLASIGARYTNQINDQHRIVATVGTTWASMHYMQDYYGVTQEQAVDYHFPVFNAQAGILKAKLSLGWNWDINKNWSLITGGSLTQPFGSARNSPLASDKTQVIVYTAGYYRF